MSSITLAPDASGSAIFTVAAPNSSTNQTLTLPDATATLVGDSATQTLTNKSIAASQLTGALPAIDGSALTGIASMTLLGTIATTSGLTQTLSGLSLTDYKQIYVSVIGVQMASLTSSIVKAGGLTLYTSTYTSATSTYATLDLTGTTAGFSNYAYQGGHTTTTSSTSISVTSSGAAFNGGSVLIYGVK